MIVISAFVFFFFIFSVCEFFLLQFMIKSVCMQQQQMLNRWLKYAMAHHNLCNISDLSIVNLVELLHRIFIFSLFRCETEINTKSFQHQQQKNRKANTITITILYKS